MAPLIALGVVSCNRPAYLAETLRGVAAHLSSVVDRVYVRDDGSDHEHGDALRAAYDECPDVIVEADPVNRGVAASKNRLLRLMLEDGADWLFLLEDDIVPQTPSAILGYLAACEESGWQHLSYAWHGPANATGPVEVDGAVSYYPSYIGAYCVYSRECLQSCGLYDEGFRNAWEHVEHTLRLARAGYTDPRPCHAADATGSENWLREIPGSIENSAIRLRPDWQENIARGREYWQRASPETYRMLFGASQMEAARVDKIPEHRNARLAFLGGWAKSQRTRLAEEQSRLAEEQRRLHAEEQSRLAEEQRRLYAEEIARVAAQARRRIGRVDSLREVAAIPVVITKPSDLPVDRAAVFADLMVRLREYKWADPIVSECDEARYVAPQATDLARRHRPGAPWLLYMEDDVILGPDFGLLPGLLREADELFPNAGLVSFFSIDFFDPGWSTHPMDLFWSTLCIAIRNTDYLVGFRAFVDYLVTQNAGTQSTTSRTRHEFPAQPVRPTPPMDLAVKAFLAAEYDAFALWCPSLVQHADVGSVFNPAENAKPRRISSSYTQAYG